MTRPASTPSLLELRLDSLRREIAHLERYAESVEALGPQWRASAAPYRARIRKLDLEVTDVRLALLAEAGL